MNGDKALSQSELAKTKETDESISTLEFLRALKSGVIISLPQLKPIERMSPTLFSKLRLCPLNAVLSKSGIPQMLPQNPNSKLGSVIHKLVELAIKGQLPNRNTFDTTWDHLIREEEERMIGNGIEKEFVPLSRSITRYTVKKLKAKNLVDRKRGPSRTKGSGVMPKIEAEEWLRSSDGLVVGKVDEIRHGEEGAVIVDLKTGKIFEEPISERIVKREYQDQLKLYAALAFEMRHEFPQALFIVGMDGEEHGIPFEKAECIGLLKASKELLLATNRVVEGQNNDWKALAKPSEDSCNYCAFRPICNEYWSARDSGTIESNDISGKLASISELYNGYSVEIEMADKLVSVRALETTSHKVLSSALRRIVRIVNLRCDTSEGRYLGTRYSRSFVVRA